MRRTTIAVLTTAVLSLGTSLLAAAPSTAATVPPTWQHGSGGQRYVALGDSFVAGPGIAPQRSGLCTRSEKNFPSLVAAQLRVATFTDVSCGGATTADYWSPQDGTGNPAQLDAVGADTTLVTLGSMGGNDAGLVGIAAKCVISGCDDAAIATARTKVDALAPVYSRLITDVRRRAPHAAIVAVGYGTYVPEAPCAALGAASAQDLAKLQGLIDRLSDTIGKVAASRGVAFADMRAIAGWRDHTPCAEPADQWIRGFKTYDDGAPLHPSTAGMAQMAAQAVATIATTRPVSAKRVAAAARTVDLRATCSGPARHRRVTFRVTGDQGLATRAVFRVGRAPIATDGSRPFRVTRKAHAITRKHAARPGTGPVRARVTLSHGSVTRVVHLTTRRPGCLR